MKVYYFENKHNFPSIEKTLGVRVATNIPKNSKAIIMLALCPGRCSLHRKGIEIDQTIFFHVTAGNVMYAVSQWPNSHPFNFLYETRLYRDNAILEILYSELKKIIRDSRILVDKKASDFVLSWIFVEKLLLAGRDVLLKKRCGNGVSTFHTKHKGRLIRLQEFHTGPSCFTLVLRCYTKFGDANFISRPSQKFLCDISGVLQMLCNLLLSATSPVALN